MKIRKVIEKRTRCELHASTMKMYVATSTAPKGLCLSLKPAVSEMSSVHLTKWNNTLARASIELTEIISKHYESSAKVLANKEKQLRATHVLSSEENKELHLYRQKKLNEINHVKRRKMVRDNIPVALYSEAHGSVSDPAKHTGQLTNIVNLSSHQLSLEESKVLSLGLNFCPATGGYNEFTLIADLHNFERNMRLREYFFNRQPSEQTNSALPSGKHWTPPTQRDKCLDLYIRAVQDDVLQAYKTRFPFRHNVTFKEAQAIKALASRNDIVIKPADKGGAVVVLNADSYIGEAQRQLDDTTYYRRLNDDPTAEFKRIVSDVVTDLVKENKIAQSALRTLIPLSPVAGRFYTLPKIHKENIPGRPIVSGIGTVTENLSRYVDTLISSIPVSLPSYIKDTNHFLNDIIDLDIPDGSFLVILDVCSLYTNIPHSDGIRAVVKAYNESDLDKSIDSSTLATLLKLILELNNFEFNGQHFIQVSGTSMGTRIGPNYANIFMGSLERDFLASRDLKPFYYKRFIDDIFLVWHHGESQLLSFISDYNNAHPNISFSHSYSDTSVNFLDVTVTLCNRKLTTKLYRKPTDRHQYLHFHSSHTKHCKTSIPYSQAIRFKRICSDNNDFARNCEDLRGALTRQGYPSGIIDDALKKANNIDRKELLTSNKRSANTSRNSVNLILTHSASVPNVANILRKHHNILQQSDHLKDIFTEPSRVVYRRSRNLHDTLTSSKIINRSNYSGCHPCNKPRCKVCPHMSSTHTATSTASNFSLKINGDFTCDSANVIYMLECSTCRMQYIGHTETSFRLRFNNHRAHASNLPHLPLSKHVQMPGHSFENIKATILQSGFKTHHDREVRESYLINKFNTLHSGINESVGRVTFLSM